MFREGLAYARYPVRLWGVHVRQILGQGAIEMATREFSKNPSKALREADAQPVLVTKYGHPIACVLSIESWNDLLDKVHNCDLLEQMSR
jgi:hypothetical protein